MQGLLCTLSLFYSFPSCLTFEKFVIQCNKYFEFYFCTRLVILLKIRKCPCYIKLRDKNRALFEFFRKETSVQVPFHVIQQLFLIFLAVFLAMNLWVPTNGMDWTLSRQSDTLQDRKTITSKRSKQKYENLPFANCQAR